MGSDSGHFDRWAGDYDESIGPFLDKFPFIGYYEVLAAIGQLAEPKAGLKVLDVGIGTGLLSAELAQVGCDVYGIDFSKKMLKKAAERIPNARLERVDVIKKHFGPFNNEKFDRVISSYFFHHLDLPEKITFFSRVASENLTESGKIIIGDIGFETAQAHNRAREKWKDQWDYDEYYWQADEILPALREVGLEVKYRQISECSGILVYNP